MIITIAVCLLIVNAYGVQSLEQNFNTTTLYPVNKTDHFNIPEEVINITDKPNNKDLKESNEIIDDENITKDKETLIVNRTEGLTKIKTKSETTTWKIDAVLSPSKIQEEDDKEVGINSGGKTKETKDFKPSPQLGNFCDEDAFVIPTVRTLNSFTPVKPTTSFISSNDFFKLEYKEPKKYSDDKPYKFVNNFSEPTKHEFGFDSLPTVESPVKVPAGGLYKYSDPFKDKPGTVGEDDFGLEFSSGKDLKKRKNPWHGFLNLVTALLPIGIIISALTPNIITLHTTDHQNYGSHFSRRSDSMLPKISERCKRRLLCEIHSEKHYIRQVSARPKHCYKIQCEDPDAMNKLLSWLLTYHRNNKK